MDLHEDAAKNTVTATFELPGLKKEDMEIDVHDDRLTVSGESKISSEHKENGYAIWERRFGKFSRMLKLPQGVKEEDIKASLDNGLLTVTFPKASIEMVPKKIAIA
ncbi:HSP20-like chaperone [Armillaria luteobubalina]|uniref:HSP20-like chaperone n=1 Tax=Armillaria luteobubalina TaxID=153913 RepID=A0AA39Q0K5_9AGAR|nr:HSP20-like chaperone [Armillaria luteobubalina]